jgi:asparagine synthase (glutamine-hydrolysing)
VTAELRGRGRGRGRDATAAAVRAALADADPLPGTAGFAGRIDDRLVRDALGREPFFLDGDGDSWAHEPGPLSEPEPLPPGAVRPVDGGPGRRLWTLPDSPAAEAGPALDTLRTAVERSVDGRGADADAVALSGGVDSALVATGCPDAPAYVVGFEGAHDVAAARRAAEALDRDLRVRRLDHDDLRDAVRAVVAATGRTNPMDVGIGATLYLVAETAAADGHASLALGQGADELFGGYAKVARLDDRVTADTVRGARDETLRSLPDGLERDVLVCRAAGVEPVCPLLHDRVVRAALALPAALLVDGRGADATRKVALRRVARDRIGDLAGTDKKAAQYGSYVARELDRLARQAGFKRRTDDHVGRWIRSL